jgi:hypothetical protein
MIDQIIADAAADLAERVTKEFTSQEWVTEEEFNFLFEVTKKQATSLMNEVFKPLIT